MAAVLLRELLEPLGYAPVIDFQPWARLGVELQSGRVDLVLLTICDGALRVLVTQREAAPFAGMPVLPGSFVRPDEMLDDTARRVLADKAHLPGLPVEQLYTFSALGRDPRAWVVSVAYFAVVPCAQLRAPLAQASELALIDVVASPDGAAEMQQDGRPVQLGFDHEAIVGTALDRLRGKLDWSMVAFGLLEREFTLFEFQRVHEIILGRPVNKPHFRKKMLGMTFADGRRLFATGRYSRAGAHRPAELYRLGAGEGAE